MALLEEVWGTDFATSPPESKQCESMDALPLIDERNQIPKKESESESTSTSEQPVTEPFTSNGSTEIKRPHNGFPLFLAILVTGTCAIYAIDLFAATISRKG